MGFSVLFDRYSALFLDVLGHISQAKAFGPCTAWSAELKAHDVHVSCACSQVLGQGAADLDEPGLASV